MNLLLYGEIRPDLSLPDFGNAFLSHMQAKRNPQVHAASLSAWNLLAEGLHSLGMENLPTAAFTQTGKPYFTNSILHFSLSHSSSIAAALLSDQPCGVDVEQINPLLNDKLRQRVLSPKELAEDADFFSVWTKKEAAVKISGRGLPSYPSAIDLTEYENLQCMQMRIRDAVGREYALCALCESLDPITCIALSENLSHL